MLLKLLSPARSLVPIVALVAFLVCAGCGAQSGETIMTQGPTADPVMGTAPEDGTYQLYTAFAANPTTTVELKEGDPLGFRKSDSGRIVAIAGDQSVELGATTTQAYWKRKKK